MNAARVLVSAVLLTVALSPRANAGVSILNAVSSCPSIIKSVAAEDDEALLFDMSVRRDLSIIDTAAKDTISSDTSIIGTIVKDTVLLDGSAIDAVTKDTMPLDGSMINIIVKDTIASDTLIIGTIVKDTVLLDGSAIDAVVRDTIPSDSLISDIVAGDTAQPIVGVEFYSRIKFGRRAAFNYTQAAGTRVRLYSHDGESFYYTEYRNKAGFGVGFEVAGIVSLSLADALALNFYPGVVFRKPINTAVVGTSEVGVSFPLLLEWRPFGGELPDEVGGAAGADAFAKSGVGKFDRRQLRLFGGVWVGVPVYAWVTWNDESSKAFKERAPADFGLAAGVGIYVSDKAFIDVRGILGLSEYDGVKGHILHQLAAGVNYIVKRQ